MLPHAQKLRLRLALGPQSGSQLAQALGLSQPTVSRALATMKDEVIQLGERKTSRYVLRDRQRGFDTFPVFRVDTRGKITPLGQLTPIRPDGFLFTQADGQQTLHEGLPWWLIDMRPQGYLGRAYVARYSETLGLPNSLATWNDAQAIRALLTHGHDVVGNLLLGEAARQTFLTTPTPQPLPPTTKAEAYAHLAVESSQGGQPGSSAGGEQPKFTAYAQTDHGAQHVLVKFSQALHSPISQRWRDLLLAEHLALETLRAGGVAAAQSQVFDSDTQRFLEVHRFDRVGALGRKALFSLAALDAEFVGKAHQPWPIITQELAQQGVITPHAAHEAQRLWAFGTLIGNTDMHHGNLSFIAEQGRPYEIAPAYDMSPMAFAPTSSGFLPDSIPVAIIAAHVPAARWHEAAALARLYLNTLKEIDQWSADFQVCIQAMTQHLKTCTTQIERLA